MNVLSLFEGDFVKVMEAIAQGGSLEDVPAKFLPEATVCKYLVPTGYPNDPEKDVEIRVDEEAIKEMGADVFYAAVYEKDGKIFTTGSRAVAVIGRRKDIINAEKIAEKATKFIKGPLVHRKDIGKEDLIQKRFKHMECIRD